MKKNVIRLDEPFVSPGVFWVPQSTETFPATLSYTPESGVELQGVTGRIDRFSFRAREIPLLVGILADATPCSLSRVEMISDSQACQAGIVPVSTSTFHVELAVIGEAASLEGPSTFHEMHLGYTALRNICPVPHISSEHVGDDVTLRFPAYREPILSVDVGTVMIRFLLHRILSIGAAAHGSYESELCVVSSNPRHFDDYEPYIGHLTGLVTLLAGQHSAPHLIRLVKHPNSETNRPTSAHVLFHYMHDFPDRKIRQQSVVTLRKLGDKATNVVRNWLRSSEAARRVFNLYLGTLYVDAYVESHFLSLAQAAESLHRVFHDDQPIPDDLFERLKATLRSALCDVPIPTEVAEAISHGFNFLNQLSFQNRLEQLVEMLAPESRVKLVGDPAAFVRTIKQTRNYLTHPGTERKGSVLTEPIDYALFNLRLGAFLRLLILRLLGAEETAVLEPVSSGVVF
ncbi:MAG TPA: HEPN domain-containing protein [Terriglobales bacterium]|nr:HEPN domain-containing protein [Terriglobales bacterium]